VRTETRLSSDKAGDLVEWEVAKAGEFKYHTPEEEIASVDCSLELTSSALTTLPAQTRPCMLALGLPSSFEDTRLFCTSEWWDRLVRDGHHRLLDVLAGLEGGGRGQ
jgi:hypothetical protein